MSWFGWLVTSIRSPAVRFGLGFLSITAAGALALQLPGAGNALWPLKTATAAAVAPVLRAFGYSAHAIGARVYLSEQSIQIIDECTGVYAWVLLSGFVLAFPAPARRRWVGWAATIPFVVLANLTRLVVLGILMEEVPHRVDLVHDYLWQVVWAGGLVAFAVLHARWTLRDRRVVPGGSLDPPGISPAGIRE